MLPERSIRCGRPHQPAVIGLGRERLRRMSIPCLSTTPRRLPRGRSHPIIQGCRVLGQAKEHISVRQETPLADGIGCIELYASPQRLLKFDSDLACPCRDLANHRSMRRPYFIDCDFLLVRSRSTIPMDNLERKGTHCLIKSSPCVRSRTSVADDAETYARDP